MTLGSHRPDLRPPLPITVVSGFLGAGKTTLINRLLEAPKGRRLAVVVNDFGAINVDARLVAAVHDDVVSLTNGCICCTIRDGVGATVLRLAERSVPPEHVIIEASGISEPGALAEVFVELQRPGFVRLAGLVTVVDADGLDVNDPHQGPLARAQVMQADLLVLTKLDLAAPDRVEHVRTTIRALNPRARIVAGTDGLELVLLGLTDADGLKVDPKAIEAGHRHEPSAHPFRTAHVRIDAPVSYRSFLPKLTDLPPAIYRVKGWLNLIERPDDEILVHVVGRRLHVRTLGRWSDGSNPPPRTELVLIGTAAGWDPDAVIASLSG